MQGKRSLRRAIRRAKRFATLTGQTQRVVRDNLNGSYRIVSHMPRGTHYGITVHPK